jgi:translation initiation factor IF-2
MPVRIYEIAKKLGLDSRTVITKAKELGINHARVASSTLDKITAEFLENELAGLVPPPPPPVVVPPEIIVVTQPEPPPPPAPPAEVVLPAEAVPSVEAGAPVPIVVSELAPPPAPVVASVEVPAALPEPIPATTPPTDVSPVPEPAPAPVEAISAPVAPPPPAPPVPPVVPPPPPAPVVLPKPKLGEKVGFIQLPTRTRPGEPTRTRPGEPARTRPGDRAPATPPPAARPAPAAPGPAQRPRIDPRTGRPVQQNRFWNQPGGRPGVAAAAKPEASKSSGPKFVVPVGGQVIVIKPPIVVRDLAGKLGQKPFKIIADLMGMGVFANVNQMIDEPAAQRICAKYGFRFEAEKRAKGEGVVHAPIIQAPEDTDEKPEALKPRAPVVTIMGHVDHGKTSLLDVIRKANVAAGESGGITQHIGAYTITVPHPESKAPSQITFLDTPGHAAFSSMRARGANVTDIVVLVVAANDGVMPQTIEALNHAKAAKVPILVAVNKCDHPNANPMKVRQQLQDKGLVPDDWGGDTIYVDVSALTKMGVDKLLSSILLQAELLELKANPDRLAKGNVIESGLEPGGPTATVLVRKGTLRLGNVIICGEHYGKVRALINEEGKRLKEAIPSVAVKVLGLNGVPQAGQEFSVVEDDKVARELADQRAQEARLRGQESRAKVTLENLFSTLAASDAKVLKLVIKGDTQGSVEAIVDALKKIDSDKVSLDPIHSEVGTITENDVALASASHAVILGFHTRIDSSAAEAAKREGVQIKLYSIIYELIDQVKESMTGLLDPLIKELVIGTAEVRKVFALSKGIPVAGSLVTNGRITRGKVRVIRRKNLVYEGGIQSLRRFQDEVTEVRAGMECGIRIDGFGEFQEGDSIECFIMEKVVQQL